MLTAKCIEGASANLQVNYFCRATSATWFCCRRADQHPAVGSSRESSVKVTNYAPRHRADTTLHPDHHTVAEESQRAHAALAGTGQVDHAYLQLTHNINMATALIYRRSWQC